jgi:ATP-dependent Clp protease ATP-binding subunit ClpA
MTPEAIRLLGETGVDLLYGARALKRTIQKELETPLERAPLLGFIKNA